MKKYYELVHFSGEDEKDIRDLAQQGEPEYPQTLARIDDLLADEAIEVHIYPFENLRYRFPQVDKATTKIILGGAYFRWCVHTRKDYLEERGYTVEVNEKLCFKSVI